jgi:hypothetical protein
MTQKMRGAKAFTGFCVFVAMSVIPILSSGAGEPIFFITHNGQDALILGTVIAVNHDSIRFQPKIVLSGRQIHFPITIRQVNPLTEAANLKPFLQQGDRALVPIKEEGNAYKLTFGASKVSSLNPETLKILDSSFIWDQRLMLQWYVNSCGQGTDFIGDGLTLSVKQPEGAWLPIARKHKKSWMPLRKASFYHQACNQLLFANQAFSILPWLSQGALGMGAVYLAYRWIDASRKKSKPCPSDRTEARE